MSNDEHPIVAAVKADGVVQAAVDEAGYGPSRQNIKTASGEVVSAPTTTAEENRSTEGQRHVNLMWESTQRLIALSVILVALMVAGFLAIASETRQGAATVFLYGVANLVIGFYFGRTNHTRTGGVNTVTGR